METKIGKIKSKADAQAFVANIGSVAWEDDYAAAMGEPRLLFGYTIHSGRDWERVVLEIYPDGHWESSWSASGGSRSMAPTTVDDRADLVWRNRRFINATIERLNTGAYYADPFS
jgi:hypothetical protein